MGVGAGYWSGLPVWALSASMVSQVPWKASAVAAVEQVE